MDKPLSPPARLIFGFVAVNALIGAVILLFFPARTATLFFWEIMPPINAALFGALYLGGAAVVGWLTWGGVWEPARFITPVLVSAGVFISITTLLHLDRFAPGIRLVYWLIIYIGAPLLALGIYRQHERGGANWAVDRPLRPLTVAVAGVLGALLVVAGAAVIAFPGPVVAGWPWPTGPLMVRIFASWFAAFGVGLLWFRVDREWTRVRLIPLMMIGASALDLAMVAVHRADLKPIGASFWLFVFHLALFGVVGAGMLYWQRAK